MLIPLDPEALEREVEVPLFHENTWSTSFSKVKEMFLDVISKHRDVYKKYVETHERRIHMYGLELRGRKWQLSWISRAFKDENLRNFVRTYLRLNKHTINFAGFYKEKLEKLQLINASETTLSKIQNIKENFTELKPTKHYPYL